MSTCYVRRATCFERSRDSLQLVGWKVLLWLVLAVFVGSWVNGARGAESQAGGAPEVPCAPSGICPLDAAEPAPSPVAPANEPRPRVVLSFFWGVGCPHCEEARPFLEQLQRERPELRVEATEVRNDAAGRQRFIDTMRRLGAMAAGIPTFVVGDRYLVGFTRGVSEAQIARLVDGALEGSSAPVAAASDVVQTKWFGRLSASELGLPLFTLALGLLDGFNPCAMWVLIFLLAMLAGQRDRTRMALTAGTFVLVGGLVYFIFMAAWLSVFLVVGMMRPAQLVLGAVALGIGALNLKDFVAFGHGPSLSIPASAKPGIYARVRKVLQEHTLAESMLGVAGLAVLVNFVELLCTAGLPAIYTSILARHELSMGGRLAYIGLYNLAYIADDSVMVTLAVVTLSRRRLAENAGRWLKLVSAVVMLALGSLLLFRPEWLP
jgi:thiol-disulfide isomerase/thioredoxin